MKAATDKRGRRVSRASLALAFRIVLTLVVFGLGVWGFALAYAEPKSPSNLAFKSLQLVLGRFPPELEERTIPWPLEVARWGLPLLTAWTALNLVWLQARNPLRLRWVRARGDHLIVSGDGGLAAAVITAERRAKRPVITWPPDPSAPWVAAAADVGAPHVPVGSAERGVSRLGLDRARRLLLAGPDDALNVALAGAALEETAARRTAAEPLMVLARVDDPDLRGPLELRRARAGGGAGARLRFVSLPEVAARRLFLTRPADRFRRGEETAGPAWLLGFGPLAESWLIRSLTAAHHLDGRKAQVVVLDPDAQRRRDVFTARRPGAETLAAVEWVSAPVDEPSLLRRELGARLKGGEIPDFVLVDAGPRTLATALALDALFAERKLIPPPIYARLDAPPPAEAGAAVTAVGGTGDFADPELLLQDGLDGAARAIHEVYLEGRLDAGDALGSRQSMREWDDLPEEVRDDNRLVADCYTLKLRDIGARLSPGPAGGFRFEGDELERLARAEHDRWAAAKVLTGWSHGVQRDDVLKLHPDLVPYDDLSEAIRDLDRDQVRLITRVSATDGVRPARDLVLWVPDNAPALDGAGLATALEVLAARHPERAPVLLGAFEPAASRGVLIAGLAAGLPVQITLSRPADATIDALPAAERAGARRLVREADRTWALPAAEWSTERRRAFSLARSHARLGSEPSPAQVPTLLVARGRPPAWAS